MFYTGFLCVSDLNRPIKFLVIPHYDLPGEVDASGSSFLDVGFKNKPTVSQGHVVMGNNAVSPYQQVIEKTKSLSFRCQMLAMNIEKKVAHSSRNEVNKTWHSFTV